MAVYKVPQDVEAEDKLVGPFGFRQFVYLGIAAGLGFFAWLLYGVSPFLVMIPLPFIFFFIVLALPLRKEQPMETYLLALLRFYLKPKLRLWNPDGTITYVEIIAPQLVQQNLAKEYGADVANERLDYLARIMDSRGWSLKGQEQPGVSINAAVAAEAQNATDILDEDASLAQSLTAKMAQKDQERRQQLMQQMHQASQSPTPQVAQPAAANDASAVQPHYNPYPNAMHQRVIQPIGAQPAQPVAATTLAPPQAPAAAQQAPMAPAVSPGILRLANNDDLSISAIAHEAQRLSKANTEVVVKLH